MLTQYKNKNNLTSGADYLSRFNLSAEKSGLLIKNIGFINYNKQSTVEMHVYSNDTWITGKHNVSIGKFIPVQGTLTTQEYTNLLNNYNPTALSFNIKSEFDNLKLSAGKFRVVVNFFKDVIGSYDEQYLYIDEISPDRTEVKLRVTNIDNTTISDTISDTTTSVTGSNTIFDFIIPEIWTDTINTTDIFTDSDVVFNDTKTSFTGSVVPKKIKTITHPGLQQLAEYASKFTKAPQTDSKTFKNFTQYLLNFSRNKTVAYVNSVVVGELLYVKLLDPLPDDIDVNFKCWVVEEIKLPYTDTVALSVPKIIKTFKSLKPANYEAYTVNNITAGTNLKNWNDLLGSSVQTSQQIVDKYFSGSLEGIPLNIDYRDFNNFIFYSSAEERLHNFKYKLELLEYYDKQIAELSTVSGKTITTNITEYTTLKTNLISGFDSFEKYLYHESSSLLFNNDAPVANAAVSSLTGSYVFPIPKSNTVRPFTPYSITSSIFNTWYDTIIASASLYDSLNINKLTNFLPPAIHYNENNEQLITFVNMLGHHYDILYTYIKQASNIYKHEENPKIGIPDELLFSVAKQFGWDLAEGNTYQDLWQYALGTDKTGGLLTGSNTVGDVSVDGSKITKMVWRRIVNNLPLLLKSKGTKRSVKALMSCYGIPESLININEYGGPSLNKVPIYEKLNFGYSLDLINNPAGNVTINYSQPIGGVELRFRLDNAITNPLIPSNMNLITISGSQVNVKLNFTRGTLGTATIYDNSSNTATTGEIELFDGKWLSMLINKNGSNLDLFINKAKYGTIVATVSASITSVLPTNGSVKLGVTAPGASRLYGQLQELRLWSGSLSMDAFANHTKAPGAYNGTVDAYDELIFRLPLTQKINHALTSSLLGSQPAENSISASFSSWTNNQPYDSIEEMYYFDSVSVATSTHEDNKIRIKTPNLKSNVLSYGSSVERIDDDDVPIDSNNLGIYFSPQTMINDDIIAQLGYGTLDSYIGDPGDYEKDGYPDLERKASEYWRKYKNRTNINEYLKIFSLFDLSFFKQLEQLLPARVNKLTGLLIQPNLLERNKQSILATVRRDHQELDFKVTSSIQLSKDSYYTSITASINTNDDLVNGSVINNQTSSIIVSPITSDSNVINNNVTSSIVYTRIITAIAENTNVTGSIILSNRIIANNNIVLDFYLTGSRATRYNGSDYSRHFSVFDVISNTAATEFVKRIQTFDSGSKTYISSSAATVAGFYPIGYSNARYNGTKIKSAGFNINSTDTIGGAPVVEIKPVKGNQININPTIFPEPTIIQPDFYIPQFDDLNLQFGTDISEFDINTRRFRSNTNRIGTTTTQTGSVNINPIIPESFNDLATTSFSVDDVITDVNTGFRIYPSSSITPDNGIPRMPPGGFGNEIYE